MSTSKDSFDYRILLEDLPHGVDKMILKILADYKGRENPIKREEILRRLDLMGFRINERALRHRIKELIGQKWPICAAANSAGGYYMARSWDDVEEWIEIEVVPMATTLLEMKVAIRAAARERFGPKPPQLQLF